MKARFGEFVLDLDRRELSRDSKVLHLSAKAFMLLEFLVRNAPKALSKEELYGHLWKDTFVDEANLANLISEVRGALAEERRSPRFVMTIHRFGYRFNIEPRWTDLEPEPAPGLRSWLMWGARQFPLGIGENTLGRDSTGNVFLDAGAVSKRHAKVLLTPSTALLEDLGSKNGTYHNGERISSQVELRDGDTIRLGSVTMTFHFFQERDTTVTQVELAKT